MTDREMLLKLTNAVDEALEYDTPNRMAAMMDACLDALNHLGDSPLGWGSGTAAIGMSQSKYGKKE